jgi:hypothetical protein
MKKNSDPVSGIQTFFQELGNISLGKMLKFFVADPDPGPGVFMTRDPDVKIRSGIKNIKDPPPSPE